MTCNQTELLTHCEMNCQLIHQSLQLYLNRRFSYASIKTKLPHNQWHSFKAAYRDELQRETHASQSDIFRHNGGFICLCKYTSWNNAEAIMSSVSVLVQEDKLVLFMQRQNSCCFVCVSEPLQSQTTLYITHLFPDIQFYHSAFCFLQKRPLWIFTAHTSCRRRGVAYVWVKPSVPAVSLTQGRGNVAQGEKVRNLNRELLTKVRPAGLSSPQG